MTTPKQLESQLREQLRQNCDESERIGYSPKKFRTMMAESGPVGACVRVIRSAKIPDGLPLNRLELTVEATVLRGPWKELFDTEVLETAKKRLRAYNRPDLAI